MAKRRIVVGATGDDDSVFAVARTLRDAGREVVFVGGDQSAEQLIRAALAEDAEELVVCTDDAGMAALESVRGQLDAEHVRLTAAGVTDSTRQDLV